jgi:uncharacterized protein
MGTEECWKFLRGHEFGRLAHHLADEVFRTAEGSKLLGVVMNPDVASSSRAPGGT